MSLEWKKPTFLALSCVGFLSAAQAADPADAPAEAAPDQEHVITVNGHLDDNPNPKMVAPLLDTPRTITVIPENLIRETGSASLVDALRTVPGITFGAAEGGNPIGDRPFIRGYDSQGSTYLDGVRDIGAQTREVFAVDQIQVVQGSDSTLGGRGSAGGTINIISKLPKLGDFATLDGSYGNADYKRVVVDVNKQISPTAAVRIEGMWHDQDVAGRDAIWQKRWGIAPSVTIGLGTPTRLTAAYYHLHTSELPDSGLPYTYVCSATICNAPAGNFVLSEPVHNVSTLGGQNVTVPYSTFYGLKDRDFRTSNTDQATLRAEHDFGSNVMIRNTSRFSHTYQGYIYTQPDDSQGNVVGTTATNTGTNFTNGGYVWRRANTRTGVTNSLINQTDVTAKFETGILKHSIAAGMEFSSEDARRGTYVLATGSTISPRCSVSSVARSNCAPLGNPNPNDPWVNYTSDTSTTATAITRSTTWSDTINTGITKAGYLFDSIGIGQYLIANLGVRYDDFTSTTRLPLTSATAAPVYLKRHDGNWNYQAGLVGKPAGNISVYGSIATSTTPPNSLLGEGLEGNSLGTAVSPLLDQLKPEKSKSYEVGAKADVLHEKLSLTLAVFRVDTTNARVTIDANTVAFIGKKRVDGATLGFNGRITDAWTVFGGYTYLDAKVRDGGQSALTAAAIGSRAAQTVYVTSVNTGKQFPQTAKHSFSAWSDYTIGKFTLGGGAFYTSRVFGGYSDNRKAVQDSAGNVTIIPATTVLARSIPSYWRFDARASYVVTPRITVSINANDLTDKRYFSQAYAAHYATVAPGRTVFGTVSLKY
ncbi:TonB-dependent receptor [Sphingomonas nostoxanthinifaciens]|uniref:TonB-dependent receptor n=1 Tax=Sphingomonas nostoxanthinifaciens TaxID=2872652 RepID=UPI001CC1EB02|nr:TonB-dependent receptor [Sphingomonas nostoxanthinifaciens]UAK24621.1 TonB-dependent receptor [Sphingomonas nostoxanthinifaciens]